MKPEDLISILNTAAKLKTVTRHCYTAADRKESVADHSWRLALFAMLLSGEPEFQDYDMGKVIRMCLIHDLGEAFTGDIPAFLKTKEHEKTEEQNYLDWVASFPSPDKEEWLMLLAEMKARKTREAKLYKALDKLEAVLAHDETELSTWLPLEYDLQFDYAEEAVKFSPYLTRFKSVVDTWTREKILAEGRQ